MKAIPEIKEPSIYAEKAFIHSEFVQVVSNDMFDVKMIYPILGMENATNDCYMRKEVYEHLISAAKNLPEGYRFRILDAWRPFLLQRELYDKYSKDIILKFNLKERKEEEVKKVISNFISEPIANENLPPVHTTGGAVDLTILDAHGKELDMGTLFDEFTQRTYTSYYEKEKIGEIKKNKTIRDNRRILYNVMTESGFTNLPSEWWHFDYGDRFWAFYNDKPAIYRGVFTKEELLNGETRQ